MVKRYLLRVLRILLKYLARATVWRYRPGIIGITGSAGKTSAKLAIGAVVGNGRSVRVAKANFNNELGLPLAILGDWERVSGPLFWPRVLLAGSWRLAIRSPYPELLVLEYGIDHPGDMKYLLSVARPNIGVLTAIGAVPVHVEFFDSPEAVAREKARLIESLPAAGFAILNGDDERVMAESDRTRAHRVTYGFQKGADVSIVGFDHVIENGVPSGITFKLDYGGSLVPVRMEGVFGKAQAYAAAAAACVGIVFGQGLVRVSDSLRRYRPAPGRMRLYPGAERGSYVLDDSYNASPLSVAAALETLADLPTKRRVAVLGDMRELGSYGDEAHRRVGELAARSVHALITVGADAKRIAAGAAAAGMKKNLWSFDGAEDAAWHARAILRPGDLVLVKGSRAVRMERVVGALREP